MPEIKFGDPQLLPKPLVEAPSSERQPFDNGGVRKPEGPGPLPAGFLQAPDIKKLPWTRARGEEWTDEPFRDIVKGWLIEVLKARPWLTKWDIVERANAPRQSVYRLPDTEHYLVIGVVRKRDKARFEVSARFPAAQRDVINARAILDYVTAALDAIGANTP